MYHLLLCKKINNFTLATSQSICCYRQAKKTDTNHLAVLVFNNLYYTSNKESSPNPVLVKNKFIVGPGFLATSLRKPSLSCRFK